MPYEITVFGSSNGYFLSVDAETPQSGSKVGLFRQSTSTHLRKKWLVKQVPGGYQIALNRNPSLVIATVNDPPVNYTPLQLIDATPVMPNSLFLVFSQGNSERGSYVVSANPKAANGFFIDDGNDHLGPVKMWNYNPVNQNWMFTQVDDLEEP